MLATGDRITKRKDGLFQGTYTAQTPSGPKRKYIYGGKYGDVAQKLAEAMDDAARGVVFDAGTLTVGEGLDAWLSDLKPLMGAGKQNDVQHVRKVRGHHPKASNARARASKAQG